LRDVTRTGRPIAFFLLLALVFAACRSGGDKAGGSGTRTGPTPSPSVSASVRGVAIAPLSKRPAEERIPAFRSTKVADANYPAGLAAAPDGRLFYSELYAGRIRVIGRDGRTDPKPWADVNAIYGIRWTQFFHGGLSGIAFDPEFASNGYVYVVTQVPDAKTGIASKTMIVRFREQGGRGTEATVLLEIPASKFDNTYSIVFGPDGMMYIPSGQNQPHPKGADPITSLLGKTLRVTREGKAPGDNPFGEEAPLVWAAGIRNAFDIAFDPATGFAIGGENGSEANDEINLIMPGHDYGHPRHRGLVDIPGVTKPLLDYGTDRVAPTGIIRYDHERFGALRGAFLMCHNHGPGLFALRVNTGDPAALTAMTQVSDRCAVDVVATPDGQIYFSDATSIWRLVS
jgi:glucose/arabinose dehydrogenase